MTHGFIDLERHPSGKQVRIRADFVTMINCTNTGTMWLLADGNQVHTAVGFPWAQYAHQKALEYLEEARTPARLPPIPKAAEKETDFMPRDTAESLDDGMPF